MPDAKYYHRSEFGNAKYNLGSDNEDIDMTIKSGGAEDKKLPMPTERTCDKPVSQDGNPGKPFFKTLESRR